MDRANLWAALAVAIPLAALFGPALMADASFATRDAGHFYYPLFKWCAQEWAAGRVPLWNPGENCGVPVVADGSSSVFYPGQLIFLLPISFALRFKLYIVAHVALAAAASYLLARAWRCSPYAAALAAIAYSCGGSVVFQYCNVVFLIGAAWLPLAAWATETMLRQHSFGAALALGVILALMVLGGDPQAAYHVLLIAGLYAAMLLRQPASGNYLRLSPFAPRKEFAFAERKPTMEQNGTIHASGGKPDTFRGHGWRLAAPLGLLGLAAGTALLLAAVQILPSAEATRYSERAAYDRPRSIYEAAAGALLRPSVQVGAHESRGESIVRGLLFAPTPGSHHAAAFDFSIGPWRLIEYFWPNISGRMFPTHRRWLSLVPAEGRIWTPTLYLGLLPALLGLSQLRLRGGDSRQRWLSWLVVLGTLGSFGFYGLGWLVHELAGTALRQPDFEMNLNPAAGGIYWLMTVVLPGYVHFRYPAKLLPLVALGLSQLAAGGFDAALLQPRIWLHRCLLVLSVLSAVAAFPAWWLAKTLLARFAQSDPLFGRFDTAGAAFDILAALVQTAVVALAAWWLLARPQAARALWRPLALLLLVAVEIAGANSWLVATAPASSWERPSPIAQKIEAIRDPDASANLPPRVFRENPSAWWPPEFRRTSSATRPAELVEWEHDTLFPKHHLASNISLIESYGSLNLLDHQCLLEVARQHGPREPGSWLLPQPSALRLLGAEFLVVPESRGKALAEFATAVPAPGPGETLPWPASASLWQMNRTLPRAWVVHHVEALPPLRRPASPAAVEQRTREILFPGNKPRDFQHTAVVETGDGPAASSEWQLGPAGHAHKNADTCQIRHYDPQWIAVETKLAEPGLLILSDAWYPGWRATITTAGKVSDAPIYRTNRVLRGVWLPAGQHTVEFRYRPQSYLWGARLSMIGCGALFLLGTYGLAAHRRNRRP